MTGAVITVIAVRIALLLYVAAWAARLAGSRTDGLRRLLWSGGCLAYLAHVTAAFHYVHAWSHRRAWLETARQTAELFGASTGHGLWLNYLFTLVWTADALWWWLDARSYRNRPRALSISVDVFLAFMFFNGAVVFARGFSRWLGIVAIPLLIVQWLLGRRARLARPPV
jgi:hypothetical protein